MIDLHLHSSCSDGILTPEQLISAAQQSGLTTIALCDHDTVAGVEAAILAGNRLGMEVIPGVELSVCFKGYSDVHLLGYWIDIHTRELTEQLDRFAFRRANRNREIVAAVNQMLEQEAREPLTLDEVEALADGVMGRPHIARALLQRGYATGMEDAFARYLVPCDVPKTYWPMEDALATIQRIGGVAVLAHPTSITRDQQRLTELISELKGLGLDGIEIYNSLATEQETMFLQGLANRLHLIPTGGSDFHGIEEHDQIGKGRGGIHFSDALLPPLRRRAAERPAQAS
ncbi:PHP domain-containing protein [Trichlorobacter lovleyi]|uniref:PHP domain-containing protein n=1 Tax=Trichlorobacter lovleyi TaxID=313985 RepID=UPI0022409180|nr:PHP domain-containing protein [Trichlorobacter lovleyi]QOX78428.1 PHP domain-containing protein [Trichlorobacter lovleyi]